MNSLGGASLEQPLLRVENLVKLFPISGSEQVVTAVSNVSFEIKPGETLGLVGESGSGKTTVGRCVLKLTAPTGGKIHFRGEDVTSLSEYEFRPHRRKMQMVFQEPYYSLNPRYTAFDTISEPLRLYGERDRKTIEKTVLNLVERVRLDRRKLFAYPHQMSGGEQQRVGIARAIATSPDLVVLDEPTSMLDLSVRAEIIDLLISLQKELRLAYLFISHDLTTVEYLCHRVAVMYLSQVVEFGTVSQVFGNPMHPYSRALLSSALPANPEVKSAGYLLEGEIPSPVNLPTGCYLASRCPEVKNTCRSQPQILQDTGGGHFVRCWRAVIGDIPGWVENGAVPVSKEFLDRHRQEQRGGPAS
jgi:oligopeptide/dipeptide ABC transporter ATP-binding protein